MSDQIDPIALIEWMWHNVMQQDGYRWMSPTSGMDITSAEVLELYKQSINKTEDECS